MNRIKRWVIQFTLFILALTVYIKAKLCGDFKPSSLSSSFHYDTEKLNEQLFISQSLLVIARVGNGGRNND